MPNPMRTRRVATAHAAAAGQAPRAYGFSATQTDKKPARSAATACSTHCCGVSPPWQRSATAGNALDAARPRRVPTFGEVRVDGLPVAPLFDEHHRRARDERLVLVPD